MDHSENNEHALNTRLLRYRSAPDSQDPHALAEALLEARRFGDARGVVVSAQPAECDDARLLLVEGKAWLCEGQIESALDRFVSVVALQPKLADGFLWLGKALLLRDDPLRAVHALEQALALDADLDEAKTALSGAEAALTRVKELEQSPVHGALDEPEAESAWVASAAESQPDDASSVDAASAMPLSIEGALEPCGEEVREATSLSQSFDDDDQVEVLGTVPGIGGGGTTPGLGALDTADQQSVSTYETFEAPDEATSSAGDLQAIAIEIEQSSAGEIDAPAMQTTAGSMHHDEADWSDVAAASMASDEAKAEQTSVALDQDQEATEELSVALDGAAEISDPLLEAAPQPNSPEGVFRAHEEEQEAAWSPDVQWDGPVVGAFSAADDVQGDLADDGSVDASPQRDSGFGLSFWEEESVSDVKTPVVACGEAFAAAEPVVPLSLRPVDVAVAQETRSRGRGVTGLVTAGVLLVCGGAGYMATRASMEVGGIDRVQTQALAVLDEVHGLGQRRMDELEVWARGATEFFSATDGGGEAADVHAASNLSAGAGQVADSALPVSAAVDRTPAGSGGAKVDRGAVTTNHVAVAAVAVPKRIEGAGSTKDAEAKVATGSADQRPVAELPAVGESTATVESVGALLRAGDIKATRKAFARLPKAVRRAEPGLMLSAEIELSAGRPWRALDVLEPIRSQPARSVALLTLLGRTLYDADQVNRSAGAYDLALAAAPKHFAALVGRGEVHLRAERTDAAIVVLERAQSLPKTSRRHPASSAKLPALLGHAYLQREQAGDRELAYNVLHAAVAEGNVIVDTHFWLGESLAGRRTPEASAAYSRYLQLDPEGRYAERARRALGPLL